MAGEGAQLHSFWATSLDAGERVDLHVPLYRREKHPLTTIRSKSFSGRLLELKSLLTLPGTEMRTVKPIPTVIRRL
jgi:hypothetical protein